MNSYSIKNICLLSLSLVMLCLFFAKNAYSSPVIIRDTEIENMLYEWMNPLLEVNDMPKDSVKIIIVQSPDINAFVAGGKNIFIYTGLLEKSENPEEVIGVLAHELGHIVGGHLIRSRQAIEQASYEMILGTLLGIGAAIVTGDGGAAAVLSAGASEMAKRKFLSFSRVQESSADQSAIKTLKESNIPVSGLKSFMEKLKHEDLLPEDKQSEYSRTHPLTGNRVEAISAAIAQEKEGHSKKSISKEWHDQHARMKSKLIGYIRPEYVDWVYDDRDHSIYADYARSIAFYRQNKIEESLDIIDKLMRREVGNPYFIELKAQILMDYGRVKEAAELYRKASLIIPDSTLIRTSLAHALIEQVGNNNDIDKLEEAIINLEYSIKKDPKSTRNHRLIATAYGKIGNDNMAQLHLAEEAYLQGRYQYAIKKATIASSTMKKETKEWVRSQDIIHFSRMILSDMPKDK